MTDLSSIPSLPPAIELDGYRLRPIRREDATPLWDYLSDTRVTRLTSYDVRGPADVEAAIRDLERRHAERLCCKWAVARASDDGLIGACGFNEWSLAHRWAELAYELAPSFWGRGIIAQAVRASLEWAFAVAGFHRVHAYVMVGNVRSVRVLERCGFEREGCLRSFRMCRGEPRDFWLYALLRRDLRPVEPSSG